MRRTQFQSHRKPDIKRQCFACFADPKSAVKQVLDELRGTSFMFQSNFPEDGWDFFLSLGILELHDRLIAAEALTRGLSLISNDPVFQKVHGLEVIWE